MASNLSLSVVLHGLLGFLQQILSFFVPGGAGPRAGDLAAKHRAPPEIMALIGKSRPDESSTILNYHETLMVDSSGLIDS